MGTRGFLVLLTVAGGVVALVGVLLSLSRAVRLRWTEQRKWELTDLVAAFDAAKGDAAAAAQVQTNREQFRSELGHYPEDEPTPSRRRMWREEVSWPLIATVLGIMLATLAGVLSLVLN